MRSYPWDSVAVSIGEDGYPVYDRKYMASDLQKVQGRFFTDGVFTDEEGAFHVSPGEGMSVIVDEGWCCIRGTFGYPGDEGEVRRELALMASDTADRIDTVVLRWDSNKEQRSIDLYVLTGTPSDVPARPTLTRSETVWELGICDVFVPAHSLSTSAERITDTRLDTERCGVCSPIVPIDTNNFFDQLQAQTDIAVKLAQDALDGTVVADIEEKIGGKVSKDGDSMSGELVLDIPLAVGSGGTGVKTMAEFLKNVYPVGSVYFSYSPTSPAALFGGTWVQMAGRFVRMAADVKTGGSDTHTLTAAQMPNHVHGLWYKTAWGSGSGGGTGYYTYSSFTSVGNSWDATTNAAGSGGAHNNMPAYQDLYAWRRTA